MVLWLAIVPKLLVAAHNYVALVDAESGSMRRILAMPGPDSFYGITQDDQGYILIAQNESGRIWQLDRRLNVVGTHVTVQASPMPKLHQILWWGGGLWVPVTKKDRLDVYRNRRRTFVQKMHPSRYDDAIHLNSVNVVDGTLYLLAHGNDRPSRVHAFDLSVSKLWSVQLGHQAHNVWIDNGRVHTLSSRESVVLAAVDGQPHVVASLPVHSWPRGFAGSESHNYVGLSRGAGRSYRQAPVDGHIVVFDRTWTKIRTLTLPGAGQIHEIRLVGEPDSGHAGQTIELA